MKFYTIVNDLLIEANKKDVLINKLKLEETRATFIVKLCGPFSVFIANKLIDKQKQILKSWGESDTFELAISKINKNNLIVERRSEIVSIMDWIRVALNGNVNQYKNRSFDELVRLSEQWHDSLGVGGGVINYDEENPIILDFREDGLGFYWVDLETNDSSEECERMGHCGRSGYGNNLYSLREYVRINEKYTKNVSYITAALDSEGIVLQMKGPKNSKPSNTLHKYIIPFILSDVVTGFGSEYNSQKDFKLSDIEDVETIKLIYEKKPELFTKYAEKKLLEKHKIITGTSSSSSFILKLNTDQVDRIVYGDYSVRQYRNKDGKVINRSFFEELLEGNIWELYESYETDWETPFDYYISSENEKTIRDLVNKYAIENEIDITDLDLIDSIKEMDSVSEVDDIKQAIVNSISDCEAESYYEHARKKLHECLSNFGKVLKMDDEGVEIEINLDKFLNDIPNDVIDDIFDRCNDKPECIFFELLGDDIEKPTFEVSHYFTPDVDVDNFNEMLKDRLNEI